MADNTIIQQGKFTSNGNSKKIYLRSDIDWMRTYNWTQSLASTSGNAVEFYWQKGMAYATGIKYYRGGSNNSIYSEAVTTGGFEYIDSSLQTPDTKLALTAVSDASVPVVSAPETGLLDNGDIVRIIDVDGAQQLGGYDFTISELATGVSFKLPYMAKLGVAGTTGYWRRIPYDTITYPRTRYITAITKASSAVITLSVTHGYTVGQVVRINVPDAFIMEEIDGLTATITAINTTTNTITVDIDSTTFSAFSFPGSDDVPFTPATINPVGESVLYPNFSDDATINEAQIGMNLNAGTASPAGSNNDIIYWVAGKSFSVENT